MNRSWKKHYHHFEGKSTLPSATLSNALELFAKEKNFLESKQAVDLGCGIGIDTVELLESGWKVLAIDQEEDALRHLTTDMPFHLNKSLVTNRISFEDLNDLPDSALVNATFSLPFCRPERFGELWRLIVNCLKPEGRFAGQFFGVDDSWKTVIKMSFHQPYEIRALFSGFTIEVLHEVNKLGKTVPGKEKQWHVLHVVAKKNPI